ncbi:hypothetical protein DPX16_6406 [Anabarilius grahami]|uniref:Uncharacterized protein n=1 Tax=Anabarilius grahami TaxID=495550 RepID=A0A3N0YLZ0_ANAGA|nr:hypothetical protein DPX16_6406 [Anabarilius grahami]
MPWVEGSLAAYISPDAAASLKTLTLPTKPVRTTSSLEGKVYMAAGLIYCLHTMAVLRAYQADLLLDFDKSQGVGPDAIKELRWATDLSLWAIKETAHTISRSMAAMVATEASRRGIKLSFLIPRYRLLVFSGGEETISGVSEVHLSSSKSPVPHTDNNKKRALRLEPLLREPGSRDNALA